MRARVELDQLPGRRNHALPLHQLVAVLERERDIGVVRRAWLRRILLPPELGLPNREVPLARAELFLARLELGLALLERALAPLHRGAAQLDGAERARSLLDALLRVGYLRLAAVELGSAEDEVRVPYVELGGALAQDLLDPRVELAGPRLALLELRGRAAKLRCARLELAAVLRDQLGDGVLRLRGHE